MFKEEHKQVMDNIDFINSQKTAHNPHALTCSIIDDMQ